ncbi:hypothetical protein Bca101_095462 [Brassica carinata]
MRKVVCALHWVVNLVICESGLDNVWDEKPLMSGGKIIEEVQKGGQVTAKQDRGPIIRTIMDGEPILSLPPKSTELRKVELSKEEVDFYKALEKETRGFYKKKETAGMVNKDFKEVLARLMRFRQACNHPLLVSSGLPCTSSSAEIARNLPYGSSKLKATLEILSDGLV